VAHHGDERTTLDGILEILGDNGCDGSDSRAGTVRGSRFRRPMPAALKHESGPFWHPANCRGVHFPNRRSNPRVAYRSRSRGRADIRMSSELLRLVELPRLFRRLGSLSPTSVVEPSLAA
jgi:hypothetical protein